MLPLRNIVCAIAVAGTLGLTAPRAEAAPVVVGDYGRFYRVYYRNGPTPDWFFHDRFALLADARIAAAALRNRGLETRVLWDGDSASLNWYRRWGRHRRAGFAGKGIKGAG